MLETKAPFLLRFPPMKLSWPLYLSVFFLGTSGVYFAAPLARPYVATLLGKKNETPQSSASLAEFAESIAEPIAPQQPAANVPPQATTEAPADTTGDEPEDTEPLPGTRGIYVVSYGHKPEWGVSTQQTSYYKLDGSRLGDIQGGTLFTCKEARTSSKGVMVTCTFISGTLTNMVFLISKKDVCLFTGSPAALSPRQRTALQTYYELNGKIILRKNELFLASASKNPYFSEYKTAYNAYMSHIEKGKELLMQRDHAMNAERARLNLTLEEMKASETQLKTEYDIEHRKFSIWKNQHASQTINPEDDPDVQKWTQEMAPLHSVVPSLTTL